MARRGGTPTSPAVRQRRLADEERSGGNAAAGPVGATPCPLGLRERLAAPHPLPPATTSNILAIANAASVRYNFLLTIMGRADAKWIRTLALATTIPMVLVVGPLLGYALGAWADRQWSALAPWGSGVGVAIGVTAGARQAWLLIRHIQAVNQR